MNVKAKRIYYSICLLIFLLISSNLNVFFSLNNEDNLKNLNLHIPKDIKSNNALTPKGIRLTAIENSSNSITITWYTESVASNPKVEHSINSDLVGATTTIPSLKTISGTYIYSADITDLEANETYYYKISSDNINEREILNFTTSPNRNVNNIRFLVYGDTRTQREPRREVVKKAIENFDDIDFTIHTGDIVNDGTNQSEWNNYFEDTEILNKKILGYYIEGNHERTNGYMYDNIPLPTNGQNSRYYSFYIVPVKFIGLNTNQDEIVQTTWLETELNESIHGNNTIWKVAYMHEPIFNSRADRSDRDDLISTWCPLFEEYGVDFVFAGHNHYYERNFPMNHLKEFDNSHLYNFTNPLNPMYFTTGDAGAPIYTRDRGDPTYTPPEFMAYYNSTYNFVIVNINVDDDKEETTLGLETWAIPEENGEYGDICLIDNITITKKSGIINVIAPYDNQLFGKKAPEFNISIERIKISPSWFKINTRWYTFEENTEIYNFSGETGSIYQTVWDDLPNGTIKIKFHANDTLGYEISKEITILKDINAPKIIISNPNNNSYWNVKPKIQVTITDPNFNKVWYGDGNSNYSLTNGVEQEIAEEIWEGLSQEEIFFIYIYANDSVGNLNNTYILRLFKDTIIPQIQINHPKNKTYYDEAPIINVSFYDKSHNETWYCVSGNNSKIFITSYNETEIFLDSYIWDHLSEGIFQINLFVNDSAGNINDTYTITLYKDTKPPELSIQTPIENQTFERIAPTFGLLINEVNINKTWYTMDNGITNYTFIGSSGPFLLTLNQTAWNMLEQGYINITFYIIDYFGRMDCANMSIIKKINDINSLIIGDNYDKENKDDYFEIILMTLIISFISIGIVGTILLVLIKKDIINIPKIKKIIKSLKR